MINCIVVDDEPLARQLMVSYISRLTDFNCIGVCTNAMDAFAILHDKQADLMFLDIQMPGVTGMTFLKSLRNPPKVIFTTAYSDYAVDAFELEAIDYLLKPITFERFKKAMQKVGTKEAANNEISAREINASIFIKVDRRLVKINHAEIIYVEGFGDYLKIHTPQKIYLTHITMGKLELLLPPAQFIRIHRSTIVNTAFIRFIEGNIIKVNNTDLAIGQTYKDALLKSLN